jgi:hypothetical protein
VICATVVSGKIASTNRFAIHVSSVLVRRFN